MYTKYCIIYLKKIFFKPQRAFKTFIKFFKNFFESKNMRKTIAIKAKNYLVSPNPSLTLSGLKCLMIHVKDFQLKMKD